MSNKTTLERCRGKLFIVLKERGLTTWRSDIVIQFTNGEATSSSNLSESDLIQLIPEIEAGKYDWVRDGNQPPAQEQGDTPEKRDLIRKRIISNLITMGAYDDKGKTDMKFIYGLIKRRWKDRFNDMPVKRLSEIVAVIENDWMKHWQKKKAVDPNYTIKNLVHDGK